MKLGLLKGCGSFEVLYLVFLAGRAKFNFSSGQCMEFNVSALGLKIHLVHSCERLWKPAVIGAVTTGWKYSMNLWGEAADAEHTVCVQQGGCSTPREINLLQMLCDWANEGGPRGLYCLWPICYKCSFFFSPLTSCIFGVCLGHMRALTWSLLLFCMVKNWVSPASFLFSLLCLMSVRVRQSVQCLRAECSSSQ